MPHAQGDVVVLPFPYSDRFAEKRRPGLVISKPALERAHGWLWVAMITSDRGGARDGDILIADIRKAGLPSPSLIRPTKLATVEPARILRTAGKVSKAELSAALDRVGTYL